MLHMQIGNIHSLRSAFQSLIRLCQPNGVAPTAFWLQQVESTGWIHHVQMVLRGIHKTAHLVEVERTSVIVHCSDGWDRTAQLAGGAELLLDSHSRTIHGFEVRAQDAPPCLREGRADPSPFTLHTAAHAPADSCTEAVVLLWLQIC